MEYLKKFDYFPKLNEEVEVKKTSQGGAIFSFFTILIGALCLIELYTFILGDPIVEPYIDKSRIDEKVRVNLNISLFETPCEALGLDFQDITGSHFEDLQQTIYKLELNKDGYVVDHNKFEEVKKFESKNFHPSHPLWERITGKAAATSCYGAELYEGQQCTTCQDVQRAYQQRRWTMPPLEFIQQCNNVKKTHDHVHAGHLGLPQLTIQLPGHAGHAGHAGHNHARMLSEQVGNFTQNTMASLKDLFREENASQFSLLNSLFVVQDVMKDSVFSFEIMRNMCQMPQEAVIEFTYTHFQTNQTKTIQTKPIHFAGGECKTYFPLKIVHVKGQELVLESYLIEGDRLHLKIQDLDDQLFKIRVLDPQNSNAEIPSAIFKRGYGSSSSQNFKGRMLHAEFYGFDDTHPTLVTPMQVAYLNAKIGTGCQIVGTMYVKKVPGNFHISTHHKGLALQHIPDKNITARHKVHLLEFTKEDGEITLGKYVKTSNFLDGTLIPPPPAHDIHYYMKIIGSTYKHSIWGEKKFYEYVAHADITPKQRNVVLLEFKYEFDPISMRYINGRKSLTGFFVSLLAIIGGIFASSTLIDRIFERK